MLKNTYNHLRGSVQIDLRGAAIERFLNLCSIHEIRFWDVKSLDADRFTAWVSVGSYFALRPYARNTGCRIRILKKHGAPFLYRKMTRRIFLWSGLILCILFVWFLSGRIWTIEVRGCQQMTQREVLELLEPFGIRTGAKRSEFQMRQLRNDVMLKTDKLSYFTVNFQGTHAVIEVWEKKNTQEKPKLLQPCNIRSDKAGIITALRVRVGKPIVKIGDTLQPGDLIATGIIINEHDDTQVTFLHAEAEADIRTWYTMKTIVPEELQFLSKDSIETTELELQLGSARFPLSLIEKNGFSWYDKQIEIQNLNLREDFRWPFGFLLVRTRKCTLEDRQIDSSKLSEVLESRMLNNLRLEKPGAQVIDTQFTLEPVPNGGWLGILKAELVETTGLEVPIG